MILSARGSLREKRWRHEGLQIPYTDCMRCDIIDAQWECFDVPQELLDALHEFDPTFEIIFDPLCREPDTYGPAFFLYKRTIDRNGPMDALHLELPIQRDCDYVWPDGDPAVPGMWFLDAWKERDNSRLAGTVADIDKQRMKEKYERAVALEAQRRYEIDEKLIAVDDEFGPYVKDGRLLQPGRTGHMGGKAKKIYGSFGG